jgi:hypothetical protein
MKKIFLAALSLSISFNAFAFKRSTDVNEVIDKSLQYLKTEQFKQDQGLYTAGEWPADMRAYFLPALLGVGKLFAQPTDEPTSFATSSVMNLLAETYFAKPSLKQIPEMINLGVTSLSKYKNDDVYSYYQWQEYRGVKVRGPLAGGYVPSYNRGLTNIPTDADTTSTTYTALAFSNLINHDIKTSDFNVPQAALDTFEEFRDVDRKSHYYNWLDGIRKSGAYLTWFQNELDPHMPRGVFPKPDKGVRIPFGFNDVDCVVNANVIRLLTLTNNTSSAGYKDSCSLLNFVIEKNKQSQCGIYYPNSYAVFFSISNAFKAGAQCLSESKSKAISFIISTQKEDGSWDNEPAIGRIDTVQSTALALNALMNYTEKNSPQYHHAIKAGVNYLMHEYSKKSETEFYWKGEVFFSAVAQARNTVLWRSNSYTTALVTLALVRSQVYLKQAP